MMPSYLYNGNSYTGKEASLYWNRPQDFYSCTVSDDFFKPWECGLTDL